MKNMKHKEHYILIAALLALMILAVTQTFAILDAQQALGALEKTAPAAAPTMVGGC